MARAGLCVCSVACFGCLGCVIVILSAAGWWLVVFEFRFGVSLIRFCFGVELWVYACGFGLLLCGVLVVVCFLAIACGSWVCLFGITCDLFVFVRGFRVVN